MLSASLKAGSRWAKDIAFDIKLLLKKKISFAIAEDGLCRRLFLI
jgi:hypothetical protein